MKEIKSLKPFKRLCMTIGNLPSSYIDSMSYYETLIWLINYLKETVIPTVNNNAESVEELQSLYVQLKTYVDEYFSNLDLQEEINNKLDSMFEDGSLSELLGRYRDFIHIKELGAIGDGTTDNAQLLQEIFNTYKNIYIDEGIYYSSVPLNISSDTKITGSGTLKSQIKIIGEIGEVINYSNLLINKIETTHVFNVNDLLQVYYEETENKDNNKRQMVVTSSSDGKLSNNLLNFNNNYSIRKINSKKNIKISDITIDGKVEIGYSQDIKIDNVKINSTLLVYTSYNVSTLNSEFNFGNDQRFDIYRGSSNITVENVKFNGGNTPSDNASLKLNEVFYSNVNNCNFGTPSREVAGYTGFFHAFMIDGDFAEDNFPLNESQYINVSNCFVSDGYSSSYFITLGKNINLTNIYGNNLHIKNSDNINTINANVKILYNEVNNTNLKVSNSKIGSITTGSRKNMTIVSSEIDDIAFALGTDNNIFIGCKIKKLRNTQISNNSAKNVIFENCEVFEQLQLSGFDKCVAKITTHVSPTINQLNNSNAELLIIGNDGNLWTNISIQSCNNSRIFYQIDDSILTDTPVNITSLSGYNNIIETVKMYKSNNSNANYTQSITKAGDIPTDGTHYRGEIIYNYAPASGQPIGWVCVANGTPGTWKSFGTIE